MPDARGFTLIETTVAVGIFAALAGLFMQLNAGTLRRTAVRTDADALVMLLRSARMDAMQNLHERPHGVAIRPADHPRDVVGFEGASYAGSESALRTAREVDGAVSISTAIAGTMTTKSAEIIFCPLSGVAVDNIAPGTSCDDPRNFFDGSVTLSDDTSGIRFTVTINHEGAIS